MQRKLITVDEKSQEALKYFKRKGLSASETYRQALQALLLKENYRRVPPNKLLPMSWSEQERRHQTGEWPENTIH